ncbi:MAG: GTPase HflX [Coriobacteriia bacterium]|nr:GTPase HflX [Coriobacteriia bacterium]MCL2536889.1 GTPase HflX [Coriobacteriia bacterium]
MEEVTKKNARAIMVGLDITSTKNALSSWDIDSSLEELERLAATADVDIVARLTQRMQTPDTRSFIGSGKVEELKRLLHAHEVQLVIFDDELSPRQQVSLQNDLSEKDALEEDRIQVMDRTALILDIFASHATTREGKLQVELATVEYEMPRLRGKWSHLEAEKLGGGVGARFGMGESQIEADRRMLRKRISELKRELKRVATERETQRSKRMASGIFKVSLVGYTNAGKSTLLNALTDADVLAYDKLFATLDSTTRKLALESGREITLTDTVGFINKLPHGLVAAFKSTLEEVNQADMLLHVVDASADNAEGQIQAVEEVLQEIGALDKPTLLVFNKTDAMGPDGDVVLNRFKELHPSCQMISAYQGTGLDDLLLAIERFAAASSRLMDVLIPFTRGELVQLAYTRTSIVEESHIEEGTRMSLRVPKDLIATFEPFVV